MELLLPLRVQWLFGQCLLYCFCIFRGDVIRTWETQIPVKFSTIFCLISWVVCVHRGFSGGSVVKSPPAVQETWVWTWVGKIRWSTALSPTPVLLPEVSQGQKSLVGCMQSMGLQRVRHDWSDEHVHHVASASHPLELWGTQSVCPPAPHLEVLVKSQVLSVC